MPVIEARLEPIPSIVPIDIEIADIDIGDLTDDECLFRLAQAIEVQDLTHLDEVAQLIARLAVTIE